MRALGKSAAQAFSKAKAFSASASESLTIYPALRCYLQLLDVDHPACASFLALCSVLDEVARTMRRDPDPDAVEQLVAQHLQLFVKARGPEAVAPKHHFMQDIGHMSRRQMLLNCFVHERRHKEVKRHANNLHNNGQSHAKHCLINSALAQLQRIDELVVSQLEPPSQVAKDDTVMWYCFGQVVALEFDVATLQPWEITGAQEIRCCDTGTTQVARAEIMGSCVYWHGVNGLHLVPEAWFVRERRPH